MWSHAKCGILSPKAKIQHFITLDYITNKSASEDMTWVKKKSFAASFVAKASLLVNRKNCLMRGVEENIVENKKHFILHSV